MRHIRIVLVLVTLVGTLTLSAAAPALAGRGGGGGGLCDGFSSGDHLRMHDSCFAGTAQLVDPDTRTLTVTNDGMMPHTVTATDDSFDLYVPAGESATLELPDAAVIRVYCTLHGTETGSGMAGVIVRDGGASAGVTTGDETSTGEETAAPPAVAALAAPASEHSGEGLALVAIIVAGVAVGVSVVTAVGARRAGRVG